MVREKVYGDIYRICMMSKTNKKLYLEVKNVWYSKNGDIKKSLGWTWDKKYGMQFDKETEAEEYAKAYFKNFNNWFIDIQTEAIGSI